MLTVESYLQKRSICGKVANHPRKESYLSDLSSNSSGSIFEGTDEEKKFDFTLHDVTPTSTNPEERRVYIDWDGPDDPHNPKNWSMFWKVNVCLIVWLNIFVLEWSSASDSRDTSTIAVRFHVSELVESLQTSMYVWGIAVGALFAGPIAETVGRNPIYVASRIMHMGFIVGCALADNLATQLSCRFFAGLGASTLIAIHGASIADIFGPQARTVAWPFVATGSFLGTVLAPVAGGWVVENETFNTWRWTEWITLIQSAFAFVITILFLPETFAPILLKWKAAHIRQEMGSDRYIAHIEKQASLIGRLRTSFHRAILMTTQEPIVVFLGLWLVVLYVCIFGFIQGFTFIFEDNLGLSEGNTGSAFGAIGVGIAIFTVCTIPLYFIYKKQVKKWESTHSGSAAHFPPEKRLIPAFPVAFMLPISLFWMGWTNYEWIGPWSDLGAAVLFGISWAGIYMACYNYILDVYGSYAGSALASITFLRYIFAGSMVVASRPMYQTLGTHWAQTLLGCIATILAAAPFIFYKFGPKIRARSRFAGKEMKMEGGENDMEQALEKGDD